MSVVRRFAFLGAPYLGGVYSVYRALRDGLADHGVVVRWVAAGSYATGVLEDSAWSEEHAHGEAVPGLASDAETGAALCRHIEAAGYDGVFVNARMRPLEMNVPRYLDARIQRILIVHSTQPGTYGPAAALRRFVHGTVGVSTRVRDDLVRRYGFDPVRTRAIPNSVDVDALDQPKTPSKGPLRLLYLGRIEERQKGVFWLPQIMERLRGEPVTLTIAGEGGDLPALRRRCASQADCIRFIGGVRPADVPRLLTSFDAMVVPSRYEGFGLTIAEAMASGSVTVASRLPGVTDEMISDGADGRLFPVGDVSAAASMIRELARRPDRCHSMASAARKTARERFSLATMAGAYAEVIAESRGRILERTPCPLDRWSYPLAFSNPLRRWTPEVVRRWVLARPWKVTT